MKFFCLVCLDILCDYILNMYIVNFNDFSLETFGSIKCIEIDRISQSADINSIFFPLEKNKWNRNKQINISLGFVKFSYLNVGLYVDDQTFT